MNNKDTYKNLEIFHFSKEIRKQNTKKNLKGFIFGNFGAMNYGDEAILSGQIQELKKIPDIDIVVASRYPSTVKKLHSVNAVSLYDIANVIKQIHSSDFVIVGGGGLINKVERGLIGFMYQLYMLGLFFLLPLLLQKKLYVLGVGIYSNANPFIMSVARLLLKHAQIITVRDHHSYEFLKSQNLPVHLYKDNSFLMELESQKQVLADPYFKKNYRKNRHNIGISLRKPESKSEEKHLLAQMSKFIIKNHKTSDFWFYSADYNPAYVSDSAFGQILYAQVVKKTGKDLVFHFVPTRLTPQRFFSSFKLMDSFIAMRLHSAIFAYRNDIRFEGISYDTKCASFLASIGKKSTVINDVDWKKFKI